MKPDLRSELSRSTVGPVSRSAVGRVSAGASRLFGGMSAVQATGRFLRKQLWAWPIVAAVLLGGAGWWVSQSVEAAMRQQRIESLTTILDADVAALKAWLNDNIANVELFAEDEALAPLVRDLLNLAENKADLERSLLQSKAQAKLRQRLEPKRKKFGYRGFFLVSPAGIVLAADQDAPVGKQLGDYRLVFFVKVLKGKAEVSQPYRSGLLLQDAQGELRANLPTMFAAAPLRDQDGKAVAALGLRIRPEDEFTRILQVAQTGVTGETYAFNREGLMLSESRFDEELKQVGLLVDQPDVQSILAINLRDPEVNMAEGRRPAKRRQEQPLTRMAAEATQGRAGVDADGYRNYRGVPVVGAWRWLEEHDIGVATEIDVAEAFRPVYILRRAFWALMSLLILSAVGIFAAMLYIARQQRALQQATLAAMQLGQYSLDEKLGAGGMGTVYRAHHKMLRRPTAVKLLDIDKMSESAIARFEREVQATATLTHPNTIAVYDYGRTPEGIFYYVMEYLEGMNLEDLIKRHGALPESRAVHLLRQACGSLAEAHALGMVHRDIKPANIFLTRRGGLFDFVKVLDFGLVKATGTDQAHLTSEDAVTGTPLYMSPEAVQSPEKVDARSDVYALGAVGYFLIAGKPVFSGGSLVEICLKHVQDPPESPSSSAGRPLNARLESIILRCLAKRPEDRPKTAADLLSELEEWASGEARWTAADAAAWWEGTAKTASSRSAGKPAASAPPVSDATVALDGKTPLH